MHPVLMRKAHVIHRARHRHGQSRQPPGAQTERGPKIVIFKIMIIIITGEVEPHTKSLPRATRTLGTVLVT